MTMTLLTSVLRAAQSIFPRAILALATFALNGCYQSSLKETPPVRFTQDHLGEPLENLLGEPKQAGDSEPESLVEAHPATLQTAASPSRSK